MLYNFANRMFSIKSYNNYQNYFNFKFYHISDANVPMSGSSTSCCYKKMNEPAPGQGFPIKVSSGFCHEPDHVQIHLQNQQENAGARKRSAPANPSAVANQTHHSGSSGGMGRHGLLGWSENISPYHSSASAALAAPSLPARTARSPPETEVSADDAASFPPNSQEICDKLLWPSASINVTSSFLEEAAVAFRSSDDWGTPAGQWPASPPTPYPSEDNKRAQRDPETEEESLIEGLAKWLGLSDEGGENAGPRSPPGAKGVAVCTKCCWTLSFSLALGLVLVGQRWQPS